MGKSFPPEPSPSASAWIPQDAEHNHKISTNSGGKKAHGKHGKLWPFLGYNWFINGIIHSINGVFLGLITINRYFGS